MTPKEFIKEREMLEEELRELCAQFRKENTINELVGKKVKITVQRYKSKERDIIEAYYRGVVGTAYGVQFLINKIKKDGAESRMREYALETVEDMQRIISIEPIK